MFVGKRRFHTGGRSDPRRRDEHRGNDTGNLSLAEAEGTQRGVHEKREAQAADLDVVAAVHGRRRAGRHDGRRDGRLNGRAPVHGVRRASRSTAAVRPVRIVFGHHYLHALRHEQGRPHGTDGNRVAVDVQRTPRLRASARHAAVLRHRRRAAHHGPVRPGNRYRFRVRPRVIGLHVCRGPADHRVPDQRPDRRPRSRVQPVANDQLRVSGRGQHQCRRRCYWGRVHRVPVGAEDRGRSARRACRSGTSNLRSKMLEQEPVVRWHDQKLDNRCRLHRAQLRVCQHATPAAVGQVAVQDHGHDSGRFAERRLSGILGTARQRDHGTVRVGFRDEVERDRAAADRSARRHIGVQGVCAWENRGRGPRAVGHRSSERRQLVRARFPGLRIVQQECREQRERCADATGRRVHRGAGHRGPRVPDAAFLLHTQGVSGGRHCDRRRVHGRGARGQADLPVQEE